MIRLGLRLTLNGGRETLLRVLVTAAAVALGVGMLLITVAGLNAVNAQNARYGWLETGAEPPAPAAQQTNGPDPLWWLLTADVFDGHQIGRVDIAATGPTSTVPPGMSRIPAAGQYYASPALAALLKTTPAAELAARYPGHEVGLIGSSALPSPDSLLIVIGHSTAQMRHLPGAQEVASIATNPPNECNGPCANLGIDNSGLDLVFSIAAAALLFPILIFIGTASRLSSAQRDRRFAAMRLVGATPVQISVICAVESTIAAVAGVIFGFGLFFAIRPAIATVPFTGTRFFPGDLSLSLVDIAVVAIGVPIAATVAARIAIRRVQTSPLGVNRHVTPPSPRAWRLIPVLAGLGELGYFVYAGQPGSTSGQVAAYLPGLLVTMAGLVIAGPWLTMTGARLLTRRARRPAALIAGRRLSDQPQASFRAISGLMLALFVTTVAIAIITSVSAYNDGPALPSAAKATVVDQLTSFIPPDHLATSVPSLPAGLLTQLHSQPGVTGVSIVHALSKPRTDRSGLVPYQPRGLVACDELARTPSIGRCLAGATAVVVQAQAQGTDSLGASSRTWPTSTISPARLAALPVQYVVVATNGSTQAIEQARTTLERAYPVLYSPETIAEGQSLSFTAQRTAEFRQLADVVILASLPIAGCSLAVSVIAGIGDRKRPFSLLRLTGAPLSLLRRVIAIESALPLLATAVIAIATGFLAAGLFLNSQLSESLRAPGTGYYLTVAAGLAASLGIIGTTLPLLARMTGPETARNE